LIAIAEISKTKIGIQVTLSQFVEFGMQVFESFNPIFNPTDDIEEFAKTRILIEILLEIKENIFIKRLLSKDATASVYQHLIKVLK
jgi:hypothetical protein